MKNKIAIFTIFLLTVPAVLFAAWGRGRVPSFNDPYWTHGCDWFGVPFFGGGLFTMILTLILLGLLVFFAVKYFKNANKGSLNKENPYDILKMRYAKGEISKETFDSMKKDIESVK